MDAHYKSVLIPGLPCLLIIRMITSERKCPHVNLFFIQFNRIYLATS